MITFPKLVFLRNGMAATIDRLVPVGPNNEQTMLAGSIVGEPTDLWLETGRWSYHGKDHPLDIVTLVLAGGRKVTFNQEVLA